MFFFVLIDVQYNYFHSSFSILLWEIATYGASPYPKIELCQVFDHLRVCRMKDVDRLKKDFLFF